MNPLRHLVRRATCAAVVLTLSGCAVPGMHLGLKMPGDDKPLALLEPEPSVFDRADIYPINADTVKRLIVQKQNDDAQKLKARAVVPASPAPYQYRIGPQDVLRITVWDHPELNNPAGGSSVSTSFGGVSVGPGVTDPTGRVVNNDGTMYYPYVGVMQVAGKTVHEVRTFLQQALLKTIQDPQVDVTIVGFRSKRAYVTGEIKTPGVVAITDVPMRVTDAIAAVGGLNPESDPTSVTLTRDGKAFNVDLYAMLNRGDLAQNFLLQDGDVLSVPDRRQQKVFVLGEVIKPASTPLPRGSYSLTEALSDAGGLSQITAMASQVYVIRASKTDRAEIYHLNAKAPDALVLADRFEVQARDVIYVDAAPVTRFNRVISQILPTAALLQSGRSLTQ